MSSLTGETRISASSANLHPFLLIIEISILVCLFFSYLCNIIRMNVKNKENGN